MALANSTRTARDPHAQPRGVQRHRAAIAAAATFSVVTTLALLLGRATPEALWTGAIVAVLVAVSVRDLEVRRIPNAWTYPATVAALILAATRGIETVALAVAGAALAGGYLFAFFLIGRGRLGLGDVKLAALVGACVGIANVPAFLLLGTLAGAVLALALLAIGRSRHSSFAYGPALALGGIAILILRGPVAGWNGQ